MKNKKVETLLTKIKAIKKEISEIGSMRPGSVTEQFHKRGDQQWPYWQISYTVDRKSKTEYIRDEFVEQIKAEVLEYKKFKNLVDELVKINIDLSKEKIEILKSNKKS